MSKFAIYAGHGGTDPGAVSGSRQEKAYTLAVMKVVTSILKSAGHTVINNRTTDTDRSISTDASKANNAEVDLTVSIHLNSNSGKSPGTGCEVYYISGNAKGKSLATAICSKIEALGFTNRGAKAGTFSILTKTTATAVLVETAFINNDSDMALFNSNKMGAAIANAILDSYESTPTDNTINSTSGYTKITGTAVATVEQLTAYIKSVNPNIAQSVIDMIPHYISEGKTEGIRGDIAFAQSCLETGNFKFEGSAVTLGQNNFCGMGVTSNGMTGNSFTTAQLGIRAQIQHLKAYANTAALVNDCIDPRFSYVTRGSAEYVEWLGIQENPNRYGWASGAGYGSKILAIMEKIMSGSTGGSSGATSGSGSTASSSNSTGTTVHTVVKGDTLSGIAQKYGTTVTAIMKLNSSITNPDKISVGQKITVSGTAGSSSGTTVHTVVKGDTLSGIAQKYGTTVTAIMKLNSSITNPDKISVGQKITVSGTAGSSSGTMIHTVVKGDTLSGIAQKYGTTVAAIVKLNSSITNPDKISIGQKIVVSK